MLKPPPLFRPLESLKVAATPRMLRAVLLVLLVVLIPTSADRLLPHPQPPAPPPAPLPVPSMDWTTDGARMAAPFFLHTVLGSLPAPGPNQIKEQDRCEPPAKMRRGGCWVAVADEEPPCDPPSGKQRRLWPEDGRCWLPVAHAKPTPTSGGSFPVNVAGEE